MRPPKLPPKRWENERDWCAQSLKCFREEKYGPAKYQYALAAAAYGTLGWAREQLAEYDNDSLNALTAWVDWLKKTEMEKQ
jgi:hypothetical protein